MAPVPHGFAHDQFDDPSTLIGRWRLQRLALRKQLLQLICSQLTSATRHEQETSLENLCGELIDYISIGHFEIYSNLMRRNSRANRELQILTNYLYRCIGSSTDLVLEFNTSCERSPVFIGSKQMSESIGKLTRSLLVRFALEEQMLELTTGNDF
jgi:regulator of sigma D